MKSPPLNIESPKSKTKGKPLPQMPVYPSGVRGYTGRGFFLSSNPPFRVSGRALPPRYPFKKGVFRGFPGVSPGLDLIILQHRFSPVGAEKWANISSILS